MAKLRGGDIDLVKLAAELVVDQVVPGDRLRGEIAKRFARAEAKVEPRQRKHRPPV